MNYEQKSNALLELLSQLADDTEYSKKDRGREIQILSQIYSEGFRHSYAKISTKVQAILEDDIDKGECLSQNLQMLKKSIEKLTYNKSISMEICNKVRKLCDHVNLEIGRYNLIMNKIETRISNLQDKQNTGGIGSSAEELNKRITEMENKVSGVVNKAYEATKELEKVDGKLERNSMSSITTLTIFSAVILAFTGSITFTSGVFSGMSNVSPYRIVFVTAMIGTIVFNLIFMLLFIVGKMVGKNICCRCPYYSESLEGVVNVCGSGVCEKKEHIPNFGCIMLHKYPYILFVNTILGVIMYYDMILFFINNSEYIQFVIVSDVLKYLVLFFPFLILLLAYIVCQIKKNILYCRTVNAVSLAIAEEYFDDDDESIVASVFKKFSETISRLFSSSQDRKKEIEKILENIPDLTEKKKQRYLIKQLKDISKIKVIKGNKNLMRISFSEYRYNKILLKKMAADILEGEQYSTDVDEDIVDVVDSE